MAAVFISRLEGIDNGGELLKQGFLKVGGGSHCEANFAEAIPKLADEIASTDKKRRFRNDIGIEIATLRKP